MRKGLIIPAVLLVSLELLSCQKSAKSSAAPAATMPAPAASGQGTSAASGTPAVAGAPGQKQPSPVPSTGQQKPSSGITLQKDTNQPNGQPRLSSAATLMALDRERPILPEDFKIGPLGDDRGVKTDAEAALAVARGFLTGLVAGKVDQQYLSADSASTLTDTLTYGIEQGYAPSSFRVGNAKSQEDGGITANVRLFGPEGTSEGEIYMAREGKQWRVADLQLSLAQMAVKREKSKQKFFPSAYRWLLEE